MKKVVAGVLVAIAAAFMTMGSMSAAQAYPDTNPSNTEVESKTVSVSPSSANTASALPNTGGPNETLLFGGAALLAAGAGAVVVARRRQTD